MPPDQRQRKLWITGTVDARRWEGGLPLPSFGIRCITPRNFWKYRCKSVQFGAFWSLKISVLNRNIQMLPTSKLPLMADFGRLSRSCLDWRPVQQKMYNSVFNLDFVWSISWHQVRKWDGKSTLFGPSFTSGTEFTVPPYRFGGPCTGHGWTHPALLTAAPEGWKAEFTWWLVRRQSPIQVVTGLGVEQRWSKPTR